MVLASGRWEIEGDCCWEAGIEREGFGWGLRG